MTPIGEDMLRRDLHVVAKSCLGYVTALAFFYATSSPPFPLIGYFFALYAVAFTWIVWEIIADIPQRYGLRKPKRTRDHA